VLPGGDIHVRYHSFLVAQALEKAERAQRQTSDEGE